MATFSYATDGIETVRSGRVLISRFENGAQQRRDVRSDEIIGFHIKSPDLTQAQFQNWLAFYQARTYAKEEFEWTYTGDGVTYNVTWVYWKETFRRGIYNVRASFEVQSVA